MVDVGDDLKVFDSHHLRLQIAVVIVQVLPRLTDLHLILFYCFCCFHLPKFALPLWHSSLHLINWTIELYSFCVNELCMKWSWKRDHQELNFGFFPETSQLVYIVDIILVYIIEMIRWFHWVILAVHEGGVSSARIILVHSNFHLFVI